MYGYEWLCRAMYGYLGLCKAVESNVYHILTNGEPLYDAYTTYLPGREAIGSISVALSVLPERRNESSNRAAGNRA